MPAPRQLDLVVTSRARRELQALPRPVLERVDAAIRTLAGDPRPPGSVKLKGLRHGYRLRVGDYRLLYEVDDQAGVVTVGHVGHRREVYRRR
ncbi:hypothetical protein A2501_04270 [Candidatus Uhrbacteria bacterium RIFOXYC12_FULL_57_11]|nr:MAG: hypothetical protein A2501_04270 [Candidatus Uhrbacteria bacterium RIFOXYC12_FULL_57_11]